MNKKILFGLLLVLFVPAVLADSTLDRVSGFFALDGAFQVDYVNKASNTEYSTAVYWGQYLDSSEKTIIEIRDADSLVRMAEFRIPFNAIKPNLDIRTFSRKPFLISEAPNTVYKYLEISPVNLKGIYATSITFRVPNSWMNDMGAKSSEILLYHYKESEWVPVLMTAQQQDNRYQYFRANPIGFGNFAIVSVGSPEVVAQVKALVVELEEPRVAAPIQLGTPVVEKPTRKVSAAPKQFTREQAFAFVIGLIVIVGIGGMIALSSGRPSSSFSRPSGISGHKRFFKDYHDKYEKKGIDAEIVPYDINDPRFVSKIDKRSAELDKRVKKLLGNYNKMKYRKRYF